MRSSYQSLLHLLLALRLNFIGFQESLPDLPSLPFKPLDFRLRPHQLVIFPHHHHEHTHHLHPHIPNPHIVESPNRVERPAHQVLYLILPRIGRPHVPQMPDMDTEVAKAGK